MRAQLNVREFSRSRETGFESLAEHFSASIQKLKPSLGPAELVRVFTEVAGGDAARAGGGGGVDRRGRALGNRQPRRKRSGFEPGARRICGGGAGPANPGASLDGKRDRAAGPIDGQRNWMGQRDGGGDSERTRRNPGRVVPGGIAATAGRRQPEFAGRIGGTCRAWRWKMRS
jgi:hypothetical protein